MFSHNISVTAYIQSAMYIKQLKYLQYEPFRHVHPIVFQFQLVAGEGASCKNLTESLVYMERNHANAIENGYCIHNTRIVTFL